MARVIVLDSGPLGLLVTAPGRPRGDRCRGWADDLAVLGVEIAIPEIADYEVRRELLRIRATASIDRLDRLIARFPFLLIDRRAMLKAAEFWSVLRQGGRPTAGPRALDADAILAGIAATGCAPGDVATIATNNVAHLARFPGIDAREWSTIA